MVANFSRARLRLGIDPWSILGPEQLTGADGVGGGTSSRGRNREGGVESSRVTAVTQQLQVTVELVYLRSWDRMGQAEVKCLGGGSNLECRSLKLGIHC